MRSHEILRRSDPEAISALFLRCGAGLSIARSVAGPALVVPGSVRPLRDQGLVEVGAVASIETAEAAAQAIDRLVSEGLPAVFVYVFDEVWTIGERIRDALARALATPYVLVEDVWAWRIPPNSSGWPAHRGRASLLDRARPELLNTWVALSDAPVDRSCIHFVPLDDDPGYPDALGSTSYDERVARPAPLDAGHALAWNANVLHWGGACATTAAGPRFSASFSLVRADAALAIGVPAVEPHTLDLPRRLELIAAQIVVYGAGQPDVAPEIMEWAQATCALGAVRRS